MIFAGCAFAIKASRVRGYFLTGWLWYLISLLPVIGSVQVGFQSMANRYAHIPLIGVFIAAVWGGAEFLSKRMRPLGRGAISVGLVLILAAVTMVDMGHWRDSEAVFSRALAVTEGNHIAHMGMGNIWFGRGDLILARRHYEEAIRLRPGYAEAHNKLALVLMKTGSIDEAIKELGLAVRHDPSFAEAYNNLGTALAMKELYDAARLNFQKALDLRPNYREAKENLARLGVHLKRLKGK
jgi:tetratricopeptide (TPR) repeat protein